MKISKKIFIILLLIYSVSFTYSSNLVFSDEKYVYVVPEDFFNEGLDYYEKSLRKSGMKNLEFRINQENLSISGKYNIFPFDVNFEIYRIDDVTYQIRITKFVFYGFIQYSKNRLAGMVVQAFSSNPEFASYIALERNNSTITVRAVNGLGSIFPEKFRHSL
ncbi:MAG: hypothetical protein WC002_00140 [Candidatus Muiribacteriota bacterium]